MSLVYTVYATIHQQVIAWHRNLLVSQRKMLIQAKVWIKSVSCVFLRNPWLYNESQVGLSFQSLRQQKTSGNWVITKIETALEPSGVSQLGFTNDSNRQFSWILYKASTDIFHTLRSILSEYLKEKHAFYFSSGHLWTLKKEDESAGRQIILQETLLIFRSTAGNCSRLHVNGTITISMYIRHLYTDIN